MLLVYITCKDNEEAEKIAQYLIVNSAAADVNVFPINTFHTEDEGVKKRSEVGMFVKTVESKLHQVRDIVERFHSYSAPCIASFAVFRINTKYKEWLISRVA